MTSANGNEGAVAPPPLVESRPDSGRSSGISLRTLLTFSLAVAVALAVHLIVSKKEPALETLSYTVFLCAVLSIALLTAPAQLLWSGLRRWRENMHPILAATALLLCFWEIITSGLRLLPLPYFPSPAKSPAKLDQRPGTLVR